MQKQGYTPTGSGVPGKPPSSRTKSEMHLYNDRFMDLVERILVELLSDPNKYGFTLAGGKGFAKEIANVAVDIAEAVYNRIDNG